MYLRKIFGPTIALCFGLSAVACDDAKKDDKAKTDKPPASIEKKKEAPKAAKPAEEPPKRHPLAADTGHMAAEPGHGEKKPAAGDAEMKPEAGH